MEMLESDCMAPAATERIYVNAPKMNATGGLSLTKKDSFG